MKNTVLCAVILSGLLFAVDGCSSNSPVESPDTGNPSDEGLIGDNIVGDVVADTDITARDSAGGDVPAADITDINVADVRPTDVDTPDSDAPVADVVITDVPDDDVSDAAVSTFYAPEYCAYFLTGEVQLDGTDADGDGIANGWDHCPNNPYDWFDSDRDGIGNKSDPDMDGDGLLNEADLDRDGDGFDDAAELVATTDVNDPSSVPGLRRFDLDLGVRNPNPGWYLGDLHVHVEYSHDSSSPISLYFGAADGAGLDFLCITDHDVFEAPFDAAWNQDDLLLIPGMEWGGSGGHANQWGIRTWNDAATNLPDDIRKSWRQARLQGGVQSLNHYGADADGWDPLFATAPDLFDELDVIEIWNLVWTFTTGTNEPSIALWERLLNEGHHIGAVGGGDSHTPVATLGSPTTAVYAESLTVPGILHGIRKGRTYITQADPLGFEGRPELDFRVDADGDGTFEAMLGDVVPAGPITLQVNVKNAKGPVRLVRNGVQLIRWADHVSGATVAKTVKDTAPAGAWYRVEMRESASALAPMRLMSSAIYVAD
jgi:hypothetical protein